MAQAASFQVTTSSSEVSATEGSSVTFTVTVTPKGTYYYQWYKDGKAIAGGTNASYVIPAVKTTDASSKYQCYVNTTANALTPSSSGVQSGSEILLTVTAAKPAAPKVVDGPKSASVVVGTAVALSVNASGTAPLTYQWSKNGAPIPGATSASYSIGNASASDAGSYTVQISNSVSPAAVSSAALLTVIEPAAVVTHPSPVTVNPAGSASFSVVATGTPPLTYQWRKGGTPITGATAATFSIASASTSDAGEYDVVVSNAAPLNAASNKASLVVRDPVVITKQPSAQTSVAGSAVTLSVAASGTDPISYQWRKDGNTIAGAVSSTLSLNTVQSSDAGGYDVLVSNAVGSVTSAKAVLKVIVPATISVQPVGMTLNPAASATFSVVAAGSEPITYQWRKNDAAIAGATSASFTLPSVQTSDSGKYDVVVTNSAGTETSRAVSLNVNIPVLFTTQPTGAVVNPSTPVSFSVATTGTDPITYQWRKDGTSISGATNSTYTVNSTPAGTSATYDVIASNVVGSVTSAPAVLTVNSPVSLTEQPVSQTVNPGAPVTFKVSATGTEPITYQWRKSGVNITGATTATLSIPNAQSANAGIYDAVVTNVVGSVTSSGATLAVNVPVSFTAQPVNTTTNQGATAAFSVTTSGTDPVTYQWRKNGVAIPSATGPSLSLNSVTPSDAGIYDVVATNVVGSVNSLTATLAVNVPVTISSQPAATTVNPGSPATFSVVATGTDPVTYQWRKAGVPIPGATSATYIHHPGRSIL